MIFPSICCLEDPFNSWDRRVKTAVLSCCTWCSHPNKAYTKELVFSRRHLARMVTKRSIRESSPAGIKPKHRKKAMIARGSSSRVSGYYPPAVVMSSDGEEIICTAVHIPGGYSALPANRSRSQDNSPTLLVEEESTSIRISNTPSTRSISPEHVPIRANMNSPVLCLVTQENFPLETCLVLRVSPELEGDMGSRLAHVWGFDSLEGLDFRLKNSSFNRMTCAKDGFRTEAWVSLWRALGLGTGFRYPDEYLKPSKKGEFLRTTGPLLG
ncbi:unnamed protein product [Rhizoctonia solani]|uniref:Uncharacterized protein n=1 Tax=Rhizoctonia solani TaxID=456999 RepID=A0A8H3CY46_9AGAM|nr:unnamed protein product [Rhizoctonia solani]